ncbi:hypothetical protein [Candidatus Thiodiazotropha endoloripes]|uniref:Uncharacterized protein n=1 Tax=Candidatus Thiodiazotropha endoloripes TaxID=1818881 RepID=A0A1E2USD2_9GAMM|nr:hypothetical protein [Candidatus Thiodiazotropha endoloripes]ODB97384.1 hypothetical protein A3196_11810 [Candidatus Thiodiazotropha endoloripes]
MTEGISGASGGVGQSGDGNSRGAEPSQSTQALDGMTTEDRLKSTPTELDRALGQPSDTMAAAEEVSNSVKHSPKQDNVQICYRPAQIAMGLVEHCWVRTDTRDVGLGGNPDALPGEVYESPYATETYVIDHSQDMPEYCMAMNNVDESCVNGILDNELNQSQGGFGLHNNCQSYAYSVVNRCRTGPKIPMK